MKRMKRITKLLLVFSITLSCVLGNAMIIKAIGNRVNFALNKSATASHYDSGSHTPDKVFDGDLSTRWGTDPYGSNQWIRVDLEKNYDFDEFKIASEDNASQKIREFKIEGSNNDNDYQLIYQSEDKQDGYDLETTINLDTAVNYRYVRITIQKLIDGAYPSISLREFEVIGNEEERISSVKDALNKLSIYSKIYRDFKIPLNDNTLGVDFAWTSANDALIINGDTVKINVADEAKTATLTVRATKDGYSQDRSFTAQVIPLKSDDYNIYPIPHDMTYGTGVLDIKENINIVINEEVDQYLIDFLLKTLSSYQLNASISEEKDDDATNIYLGIDGDGSLADNHFKDINRKNIEGIDEGYALNVSANKNVISILGNDYFGLFSGVFTLKEMLNSSIKAFKDVTIIDAPDTKFRGIVEGFYGSYSHKERLDLLEFMGPLKMNTYIYGSKSDVYHTGQWRELYPEKQINELEELVTRGKENNVEVVWAAHVGGKIDMSNEADFEALVNKFDQLYSIGVRQFGLFYDDAATDNTHLVDFVNKVNKEYVHKREGVKDLIICPEQYCKTRASGDYLDRLAGFDQDIQIMWTGDSVISAVTPEMMEYIENRIKRPAYIWWNYPVNDLGMGSQMLVGETVGLSTEMNKMNGLVSNPMLQAQASKFSLFSIADYGWNIADFDQYKSWENSIDYLIPEKEYAEAFKIFSANNNQSVAELQDQAVESAYLLEQMKLFKQDLYLGFDISESGNDLLAEFKKIEDSCELLKGYSANQDLVNQIRPWLNKLISVSQAGQSVLENLLYLNDHPAKDSKIIATAHQNYLASQEILATTGGEYSGRRELLPFIYEMQRNIGDNLVRMVGSEKPTPITNYRNGAYLMMDLSKMTDGDLSSLVTFERNEAKGHWYGLDLGKITEMERIQILVGNSETDQNVAKQFKVQISNDGFIWKDIEVTNNNNRIKNVSKESARFVRYYVEEGCGKASSVREFNVNNNDMTVTGSNRDYQNLDVIVDKNVYQLGAIDNFKLSTDHYIGVEFARAKQFSNILVNDELKELTLQHSTDGINWTDYENGSFIARFVRLINKGSEEFSGKFDYLKVVGPEMFTPENIEATLSSDMVIWSGNASNVVDGNRETLLWTRDQVAGQSITLDLKKQMPINDVCIVMKSGDVMHAGVVEISNDKVNWTKVGDIIRQQENIILVEDQTAQYVRIRVTANSTDWLKINEIEINQISSISEVPVIEDANAKQIIDQDATTKYTVPSQAGEIIYNNINNAFATTFNILKSEGSLIKIEGLFGDEWKEIITSSDAFVTADFTKVGTVSKFKLSWQDNANLSIYEVWASNPGKSTDINRDLLLQIIEKAAFLKENGYLENVHPTVVEYFNIMLSRAIEVSLKTDINFDELMEAYTNLAHAIQLLDFTADKTALKELIVESDLIDLDLYEEIGKDAFILTLDYAKEVYKNENALDETSINQAFDKLLLAKGKLVLKEVNTKQLELMIKLAKKAIEETDKYKQDSNWEIFMAKLDNANEVLADPKNQDLVDQTTRELSDAYTNLRIKPDEVLLDELRKFLDEIKDLDLTKYSSASQKIIYQAIKTSKNVLSNEDVSQYELLEAVDLINQARKIIDHPDDVQKEVNFPTENQKILATGDNENIIIALMTLVLSAGIIYCVSKYRKIK